MLYIIVCCDNNPTNTHHVFSLFSQLAEDYSTAAFFSTGTEAWGAPIYDIPTGLHSHNLALQQQLQVGEMAVSVTALIIIVKNCVG